MKEADIIKIDLRKSFKKALRLSSAVVLTCASSVYAAESFDQYQGASLLKFDQSNQTDYSLPLANLKKSARAWIPIKSKRVQGDLSSSLYKFGRDEALENIYQFYRNQLIDNANILYECQGRTCGSSNAWANNFFNDYRLNGADANQSLLVVENLSSSQKQYHLLYLNRRGAGDVVLRLDSLDESQNETKNDILFQTGINKKLAVKDYLARSNDGSNFFILVSTSKGQSQASAYREGETEIESLKRFLGARLVEKVTFINLGNKALPDYGENSISILLNQ